MSYTGLSRLVGSLAPDYESRADLAIVDVVLENAIALVRELERTEGAEVIISAGANAAILRTTTEIPVVTVKVTGYDVMLALLRARQHADRVGVVTYRQPIPELEKIKELLKIEVVQHSYSTMDDAQDCCRALADTGIEVIVGSSLVVELAERSGLTGILIYSSAAVRQAIEEAVEIARVRRLEAERYGRINSVLKHLHEAVLAVDEEERVIAINPLMEDLLGCRDGECLGRELPEIARDLSLGRVLATGIDRFEEVVQLSERTFVANRLAIRERGAVSGAVLILQDAAVIQRADTSIRTQRRSPHKGARYHFRHLTGKSPAFRQALLSAERYARTNATVLISGESGTGKELFAQSIHNAGGRRDNPFIALNCAAFPEPLLESELFGYEEGAFTGSRKGGKPGLFEAAHTGTIFLDEIGDMPMSLQTRLLRVLQEKEVVRLGHTQPIPIDVRVVAATHRSLEAWVEQGRFRDDLYYRLNLLRLHLPPLRERSEDVPLLALQMLHAALRRLGSSLPADQALAPLMPALQSYCWPGNVRELENVMERLAVILWEAATTVDIDYVGLRGEFPELFRVSPPAATARGLEQDAEPAATDRRLLLEVLRSSGDRRTVAARKLGISRTTLWRRLRELE